MHQSKSAMPVADVSLTPPPSENRRRSLQVSPSKLFSFPISPEKSCSTRLPLRKWRAGSFGVVSATRDATMVITSLLLQCHRTGNALHKTSLASPRELDSKMTRQQLPPWPWFCLHSSSQRYLYQICICFWPLLSDYAECLGLSSSYQSLKSLRGSRAGQGRGGSVLAQLRQGAHLPTAQHSSPSRHGPPHGHRQAEPAAAEKGRALHPLCRSPTGCFGVGKSWICFQITCF